MAHPPFQCIFCKSRTADFTSCEHIVPESLGNNEHILPPGVVCDGCNNYFACKVEGPILGSGFLKQARHRNGIPSKRNRVPSQSLLSYPSALPLELGFSRDGSRYLAPSDESDGSRFINHLRQNDRLIAICPVAENTERRLFARLLLLVGIECLAQRLLSMEGGIARGLIDNATFDVARRYCRFNEGDGDWPYHECCLYPEQAVFRDSQTGEYYHLSHEFTLLLASDYELYFVFALLGTQYKISLVSPEIEGFHKWLANNDNMSPLYPRE